MMLLFKHLLDWMFTLQTPISTILARGVATNVSRLSPLTSRMLAKRRWHSHLISTMLSTIHHLFHSISAISCQSSENPRSSESCFQSDDAKQLSNHYAYPSVSHVTVCRTCCNADAIPCGSRAIDRTGGGWASSFLCWHVGAISPSSETAC